MHALIFCETPVFHITSLVWPIVLPLFFCFKGISGLGGLFMLLVLRKVNKFEMKGGTKNRFSPLYARPFCPFLQEHAQFCP